MEDLSLPPAVNARLQSLLHSFDFAFVVSDCSQADMPIVFASSKFFEMTGYSPEEVRLRVSTGSEAQHIPSAAACCCCAQFCMRLLSPEYVSVPVVTAAVLLDILKSSCIVIVYCMPAGAGPQLQVPARARDREAQGYGDQRCYPRGQMLPGKQQSHMAGHFKAAML
jgi:hypothetical protein